MIVSALLYAMRFDAWCMRMGSGVEYDIVMLSHTDGGDGLELPLRNCDTTPFLWVLLGAMLNPILTSTSVVAQGAVPGSDDDRADSLLAVCGGDNQDSERRRC